jgi:hypothetical protein
MKQYQYTGSKPVVVKPQQQNMPVESRILELFNRLTEQNELQARQIRRLENDLAVLKETLYRNSR